MEPKELNDLLEKYKKGTASKTEKQKLNEWHRDIAEQTSEFPEREDDTYNEMLSRLNTTIVFKRRIIMWPRLVAAASIIIVLGIGALIFFKKDRRSVSPVAVLNDIAPGGNKAVLTLADGRKISLTDVIAGKAITQSGVTVVKSGNGQVVYQMNADKVTEAPNKEVGNNSTAYNRIETPAGGQFQIVLPDGSMVWLNAMSSIRFPTNFSGQSERRIELKGEAYFIVKHDPRIPFKVITENQITEDIGTEFDVEAYQDNTITKTTLLQGAVKVTSGINNTLLTPGQQARADGRLNVVNVNVNEVIAWKNGYFHFEDETLGEIMKKVSRWYNVNVVYLNESDKTEHYGIVTTRFNNISTLLKLMEQIGNTKFRMEDRTVIVGKAAQ